jgi:hypothetical protein
MGELNNVLNKLASNPKVHQTRDIIVVDIPETYRLLLSKYWFSLLMDIFPLISLICGFRIMGNIIK